MLYNGACDESCKAKTIWHGVPTALSGFPHLEEKTKSKDANLSYNPTFSETNAKGELKIWTTSSKWSLQRVGAENEYSIYSGHHHF